jgi:hypothetical protein
VKKRRGSVRTRSVRSQALFRIEAPSAASSSSSINASIVARILSRIIASIASSLPRRYAASRCGVRVEP